MRKQGKDLHTTLVLCFNCEHNYGSKQCVYNKGETVVIAEE